MQHYNNNIYVLIFQLLNHQAFFGGKLHKVYICFHTSINDSCIYRHLVYCKMKMKSHRLMPCREAYTIT